MANFGWSYPAGCDSVPADEEDICLLCGEYSDDCECAAIWHFPHDGVILLPAYGRKAETPFELTEQWLSGKAMKIKGGPYCSISDQNKLKKMFNRIYLQGSTQGVIWWIAA